MDVSVVSAIISLGILGLIFGCGLAYASKRFATGANTLVEEILELLPGVNCGACGFPGCQGYAEAIAAGKADVTKCGPGGEELAKRIAALIGVEVGEVESCVAVVQCKGGKGKAAERAIYDGIEDCRAAHMISDGPKACIYGCLGLGSCVRACPFEAIYMGEDGLPVVIEERCTGCGKCVSACPRGIMKLIPRRQKVYLGCVSKDRGKDVKEVCSVGCIGCRLCASPKVTPSGAVKIVDNIPVFGPDWEDFEAAVEKCPNNCFVVRKSAMVTVE